MRKVKQVWFKSSYPNSPDSTLLIELDNGAEYSLRVQSSMIQAPTVCGKQFSEFTCQRVKGHKEKGNGNCGPMAQVGDFR
jgi:hypothetical protein